MLNYSAFHVKFVASIFNYEQFAWEVVRRFFLVLQTCSWSLCEKFWRDVLLENTILPRRGASQSETSSCDSSQAKEPLCWGAVLDLRCFSGEPGHCPAHTYISWIFVIIMGDLVSEAS